MGSGADSKGFKMAAVEYTLEEEQRYRLPPLPDVETQSASEAARRNADYVAARARYREMNPHREKGQ